MTQKHKFLQAPLSCLFAKDLIYLQVHNMPIELAEKSMRMFAKEVMPALKEIDTTPITMPDAS